MKNILTFAAVALAGALSLGAVQVETKSLRVVFYENDVGKGRIGHVVDRRTGREMASQKMSRPLWMITCIPTNDFTKKRVVHPFNADKSMRFETTPVRGGWQFAYRNVCDCLDEVVCRVTADEGDGMIRWRIASRPKPGWATYETDFPTMYMTESIGTSPADDCTHMGSAKGGVNRYPMRPGREYWKNRHYATSPGHLSCPYGAFYDPEGGLYTAAEDGQGHFKGLLLDRWWRTTLPDGSYGGGDFLLEWRHFEYSERERDLGYDIVMRGFTGTDGEPCDWRDAADIYRDTWASKQRWMATKMADRRDLPDWAKRGPVKVKFNRAWYSHPGLVQRWIREYWTKRFPGVPFVVQTEGWERHGDWVTPEYFPCYPDDDAFGRVCADLKKADGHVWAWPGGHHWNVRVGRNGDGTYRLDYTDLFNREVRPNCCVKEDGSPSFSPLVWLGGGDSATLCPATDYGRNWWNDYVSCGLVRRGVGLVQADQDVCARIATCWSRDHGHAPGDGRWMTLEMRRQFETMLEKMRKIDPWAQFSFEEPNEYYNDILCFQDYRNCRFFGGEWASAFNYLYHEYLTPYQPGSELWSKWFWVAHAAADGQMPTFPESPEYYFEMPALYNGSFEDPQLGLTGYKGWNSGQLMQKVVTDDATDGRYALGLESAAGGARQEARHALPEWFARQGGKLRITFAAKRMAAGGVAGACVRARGVTGALAAVEAPQETNVWRRLALDVDVPKGTSQPQLVFQAAEGAVWRIDDVKLLTAKPNGDYGELTFRRAGGELAFAERWADLWHANAKWLQHGRHLHPPRLSCMMIPYHESFRGSEADLMMPAVFVGAFRAADGSDALFFVNATDERQDFTYVWRGKTEKRSLAARELRLEVFPKHAYPSCVLQPLNVEFKGVNTPV